MPTVYRAFPGTEAEGLITFHMRHVVRGTEINAEHIREGYVQAGGEVNQGQLAGRLLSCTLMVEFNDGLLDSLNDVSRDIVNDFRDLWSWCQRYLYIQNDLSERLPQVTTDADTLAALRTQWESLLDATVLMQWLHCVGMANNKFPASIALLPDAALPGEPDEELEKNGLRPGETTGGGPESKRSAS